MRRGEAAAISWRSLTRTSFRANWSSEFARGRTVDPRTAAAHDGFALIFTLWAIGLLTLLFAGYIAAARYRSIEASGTLQRVQAEMASRAGVNIAIFELLSTVGGRPLDQIRFPRDGTPFVCRIEGATLSVQVEDEGGKVDLNTAEPELLARLMRGLEPPLPAGGDIVTRIVAYRTPPERASNPGARSAFRTVLELDQLAGMTGDAFRYITPLVTVHSRARGIDPQVAPIRLLRALSPGASETSRNGLQRDLPPALITPSTAKAFAVRAVAQLPSGARHRQDSVVELTPNSQHGYRVHEWRSGFMDGNAPTPNGVSYRC